MTAATPSDAPAAAAPPDDLRTAALEALRDLVGRDDATFHDGQFEAIQALVEGRRRALVVQRTGWGKSAVYFVATLLLRRRPSTSAWIASNWPSWKVASSRPTRS